MPALSGLEVALVGVTRNGARFLARELDRMRQAMAAFGRVAIAALEELPLGDFRVFRAARVGQGDKKETDRKQPGHHSLTRHGDSTF